MKLYSKYAVFPDGSTQEIRTNLRINQIVDLNGTPLPLPLGSSKIIAYRVIKQTTRETRGEENVFYHLELVWEEELREFT